MYPWTPPIGSSIQAANFVAVAPVSSGSVMGEGFVDPYLAQIGFGPAGGSLAPATVYGQKVMALHTIGAGGALVLRIRGALPQDFFTSVTVPGVHDGEPLNTAAVSFFSAPDPVGNSVWMWAVSGLAESGDVIFE